MKPQYIDKAAVMAEIEKKKIPFKKDIDDGVYPTYLCALMDFEDFINTLEVKEIQEEHTSNELKIDAYWKNKYKEVLKQLRTQIGE